MTEQDSINRLQAKWKQDKLKRVSDPHPDPKTYYVRRRLWDGERWLNEPDCERRNYDNAITAAKSMMRNKPDREWSIWKNRIMLWRNGEIV